MNNLEWNDELKLELLRLKSEISPQNLRVLSDGLGLGSIKKVEVENPVFSEMTHSTLPKSNPTFQMSTKPSISMPLRPQNGEVPLPSRHRKRTSYIPNSRHWIFYLSSHVLDITFILFSILLGVISLGLVFDFDQMASGQWREWLPLTVLSNLGYGFISVAVYGLFAVYFIFFRIFLGKTLGENMVFPEFRKNREPSRRSW